MFRDKQREGTATTPRRRRVTRPANVIAGVVGILAITLGVWALIETGLNTDHIFTPTKEVLGLPHTPALALGEIGFGILLLFSAAAGAFGAFLVAVFGVASLAFGVIVVSDSWPGRVHSWTAADHDTGWMFILIGAVFVLAATLPLFVSPRPAQTQAATEPEPVPVPAPVKSEPAATVAQTSTEPDKTGTETTETGATEPDNTETGTTETGTTETGTTETGTTETGTTTHAD